MKVRKPIISIFLLVLAAFAILGCTQNSTEAEVAHSSSRALDAKQILHLGLKLDRTNPYNPVNELFENIYSMTDAPICHENHVEGEKLVISLYSDSYKGNDALLMLAKHIKNILEGYEDVYEFRLLSHQKILKVTEEFSQGYPQISSFLISEANGRVTLSTEDEKTYEELNLRAFAFYEKYHIVFDVYLKTPSAVDTYEPH